jgi:hypothetical protein
MPKVKLSEIRAKFPMYNDVPDDQLLIGLHRKYYADIPFSQFNGGIEYDTGKSDPTEGMTSFQRGAAGFGKAIVDTARGAGQFVGLTDRADVEESRRLDSSLMDTTAGKVGNFAGNVATTLPLAFVPGANTVKGASLIGAGYGLLQPSTSTTETAQNVGLGGVAGGGSIIAGRALASGYNAVGGVLRPMTKAGQKQIAAELLQTSATDPRAAAARMAGARELVPGSAPTVGQVSDDAGLAQLERTLFNKPETAGPLNMRYQAQQEARQKAISDVAGTPSYRADIEDGRSIFAKQDYDQAISQGIDPNMAASMQPQIDSLMARPSMQQAQKVARRLAAESEKSIDDFGSIEGMDWLKKALDNQISKAAQPGSSIGKADLRALLQTKDDLMKTLEHIAPAYKVANDNFAAMSKQVNSMDVAADLQKRLYKNAQFGGNKELGATYQNALADALDSIKRQTGQNRALSDVMPTKDLNALEAIARDIVRKEKGQTLGRATGSPTMQNMMGQNLMQRVLGPLGAPQSVGQNALMQTLSRPYGFITRAAEPSINDLLAESMSNPALARSLLQQAAKPSRIGSLAGRSERFLPVPALTALEGRQQ